MVLAVMFFTVGDATTKYLTTQRHHPVIQVLTIRSLFALVATGCLIVVVTKLRESVRASFFLGQTVALRTVFWALAVFFFGLSFNGQDLSSVYVVVFLTPIIVFAVNILRGKAHINILAGVVSGLTFILVFVYASFMKDGMNFANRKFLYSLVTAVSYAIYLIFTDMVGQELDNPEFYPDISSLPKVIKSMNMTLSVLILGIPLLIAGSIGDYHFFDHVIMSPSTFDLFVAFCAGLFSAAGIFFGAVAYSFASSADVAPWENLAPVFSVPIDWWRGETAQPGSWILAAVIMAITSIFGIVSDEHSKERILKWMQLSRNGKLTVAIWGAVLALFINAATILWSNYLTRRDQHVQEADKCNGLTASLISMTSFARDAAQAAASALARSASPSMPNTRFILPPIDEILHSQDQLLDNIDPTSRNAIFQLESYYRTIRDDLSHTEGVKAEGETFSLPPNSPNREFYENLLRHIVQVAGSATDGLDKSPYCDDLAKTEYFSSRVRPHSHVSAQ